MRIRPLEMSEWSPKILTKLASIGRVRLSVAEGQEEAPGGNERKRPPSMLKTADKKYKRGFGFASE